MSSGAARAAVVRPGNRSASTMPGRRVRRGEWDLQASSRRKRNDWCEFGGRVETHLISDFFELSGQFSFPLSQPSSLLDDASSGGSHHALAVWVVLHHAADDADDGE